MYYFHSPLFTPYLFWPCELWRSAEDTPQPGTCPVIYSREMQCWHRYLCRRWNRTACSSPDHGSSHRAGGSSRSTEEEWRCRGGRPLTGWSGRCRARCAGVPGWLRGCRRCKKLIQLKGKNGGIHYICTIYSYTILFLFQIPHNTYCTSMAELNTDWFDWLICRKSGTLIGTK